MNYVIKGNITPRPFQHEGIITMLERDYNSLLCDQMGLGKTIQSAVWAYNREDGGKIVVCPASLKLNWDREIKKLYPDDTTWIAKTKKDEIPQTEVDWYIINYDLLKGHIETLCRMAETGVIKTGVVDEAHMIKNQGTKRKPIERTMYTLQLCEALTHVLPVTGSPITNRPAEAHSLLIAIGHELGQLGKIAFDTRYCDGKMMILPNGVRYWDNTGVSNPTELHNQLQGVMIRRIKKDVLTELPDKTITQMPVELNKEWRSKYNNTWQDYLTRVREEMEDEELTADEILESLTGKMDAQHLIELGKMKQVTSLAKLDRVFRDTLEVIEQGEKVIIFSQFTEVIQELLDRFSKKEIQAVSITGQHNQDQRQKAVDDFQTKEDVKVFVGNIRAAGVGITLTEASVVMFVDTEWSPEIQAQAEDRAHRIGQKNAVNVYYYLGIDTVDEEIYNLLQDKKMVIDAVVDGSHKLS